MRASIDGSSVELIEGDCLDVLKGLEEGSAALVMADPPYNVRFHGTTSDTGWDSMPDDEWDSFMIAWMTEAKRVLRDDGAIWLFCDRTKIPEVFRQAEIVGLHNDLENWLIWCRSKGRSSRKRLKSVREDVLHLTKTEKFQWNAVEYLKKVVCPYVDKDGNPRGWATDAETGERVRFSGMGNVAYFSSPSWCAKVDKQIHSTQKPVALMAALTMMGSSKGDLVVDPFMGSGASGLGAVTCDRNFVGIDNDGPMLNKATDRILAYDRGLFEGYFKRHLSSSEPGFKFGFDKRGILRK